MKSSFKLLFPLYTYTRNEGPQFNLVGNKTVKSLLSRLYTNNKCLECSARTRNFSKPLTHLILGSSLRGRYDCNYHLILYIAGLKHRTVRSPCPTLQGELWMSQDSSLNSLVPMNSHPTATVPPLGVSITSQGVAVC